MNDIEIYLNHFSGTLSSLLGDLTNLKLFRLHSNEFWGTIPSQFKSLTVMSQLMFGNNKFSGFFPSEISSIQSLLELDLSFTSLVGRLPSNMCDFNLQVVYLSNSSKLCYPPCLKSVVNFEEGIIQRCPDAEDKPN